MFQILSSLVWLFHLILNVRFYRKPRQNLQIISINLQCLPILTLVCYILSEEYLTKLQRFQNSFARAVTRCYYADSATLLARLPWLPIRSRIAFKLCVITYEVIKFGYPESLRAVLSPRRYSIGLHFNLTSTLKSVPKTTTIMVPLHFLVRLLISGISLHLPSMSLHLSRPSENHLNPVLCQSSCFSPKRQIFSLQPTIILLYGRLPFP